MTTTTHAVTMFTCDQGFCSSCGLVDDINSDFFGVIAKQQLVDVCKDVATDFVFTSARFSATLRQRRYGTIKLHPLLLLLLLLLLLYFVFIFYFILFFIYFLFFFALGSKNPKG